MDLGKRFSRLGYSPNTFVLRMTREEIGSYLGLSLETVSRLFSRFQEDGLVDVQTRHLQITNPEGLTSNWCSATFVLMPSTTISDSAMRMRRMACSRVSPYEISLAIMES